MRADGSYPPATKRRATRRPNDETSSQIKGIFTVFQDEDF